MNFGVFDIETGKLCRAGSTNDLRQVQVQARPGQVVLEGDYSSGLWQLGGDGWPEAFEAPPVAVTARDIKYFAYRQLQATQWKCDRHRDQLDRGEATSLSAEEFAALLAERQAVRDASNRIEAMDPIPADYRQSHYWSAS